MPNSSKAIRVMIVDDSTAVRAFMARMVSGEPDIEVVTKARDGQQALDALGQHDIDVVLLDIEMPVMDGMTALPLLRQKQPSVVIIMTSSLTLKGAEITMRALEIGANDFIPKPTTGGALSSVELMKAELLLKIRTHVAAHRAPSSASTAPATAPESDGRATVKLSPTRASHKPRLIAIGSSTGGPNALEAVIRGIPEEVRQPIVITQHMPPMFTTILAKRLDGCTHRHCVEAETGMVLESQRIYIAPGDYHLTLKRQGAQIVIQLDQGAPVHFCRPAVDVMFGSTVKAFGGDVLAVVLTGMGEDGKDGAREIVAAGGAVIAQDKESSVVWGMPGAVTTAGLAAAVLPLNEIAGAIRQRSSVRTNS